MSTTETVAATPARPARRLPGYVRWGVGSSLFFTLCYGGQTNAAALVEFQQSRANETAAEQELSQEASAVFGQGHTLHVDCESTPALAEHAHHMANGEADQVPLGYVPTLKVAGVPILLPEIHMDSLLCEQAALALEDKKTVPSSLAVLALGTLAHEAQHIVSDDTNEAAVQCRTDQLLASQLTASGYSADLAGAIAKQFANGDYPAVYSSPACRPGGALDIHVPQAVFPEN